MSIRNKKIEHTFQQYFKRMKQTNIRFLLSLQLSTLQKGK